jgi:hypothetical protein
LSVGDRFEPERIVDALDRAGVRYVIVGGLAAGAHGAVRATRDLDIVPDGEPSNMAALAHVLDGLGGRHPVEGSMKLETARREVHVLNRLPGTPAFRDLDRARILAEIDSGVDAPVCSLEHLRAMKRASDRPRDAVDLTELDELHGLGPDV